MLTDTNLHELLEYKSKTRVLSVYLNTDPSQGNADVYRLHLRSMLKDIDLPEDVEAVEQYVQREFEWSGRSVAIFSCAADGFFKAYPLAVPVRSRVRIDTQPHVKPLANVWDFYGGYGVVLVDKQGARVFLFHLGELIEQEGHLGEAVRHTKSGGASAVPGRRGGSSEQHANADGLVERNMKDVAEMAVHFFAEHNVRRLLIGGTDDNVALLRGLLPKNWQSLVVGTFPMSMMANKDEVLARALQVGQQAEMREETEVVEKVVTTSAKGRGGVVGLDQTLAAVHDNRVQMLVFQDGYRAPGYRCQGCGFMTANSAPTCPYCGAGFERVVDAVELAVRKVLESGGDVEVLQYEPQVAGFDQIGAVLRY
ncbi:MAG TPA: hypothetical protein PKM21_05085 [Anaerolineales bacterium]|nr:hypothetical protein [Anaerolineales bacterium]